MEDSEEIYKTICRVCLSTNNSLNMVSLTDIASEDGLSCYGKAVLNFANITIKNDSLPTKMCEKCLILLKQAIIFKKTCENSDESLTKLSKKLNSADSDFKANLCDYLMFKESFPEECVKKRVKKRSVKKIVKKTIKIPEVEVKNELTFDMDLENDFEDLFFENTTPSRTKNDDENVDEVLDRMEIVADMTPGFSLLVHRKRYKKRPKQHNSDHYIKRQKRKRQEGNKNEEDLQCKICMKVLCNPNSLYTHIQRHSGGQFICEQCGRTFKTNAELQYHLASTHDIGPQHVCKICGFKAPKKHELIEHERIHTGERPYTCDKCGLTFRRQYIWKKHALYHKEKSVQCPQCPKKFHQKGELMAHVNGVHNRMYIYQCSHCDVTYAKTCTVRRHMTEKHGIARGMQGRIKRINLGNKTNNSLFFGNNGLPTQE